MQHGGPWPQIYSNGGGYRGGFENNRNVQQGRSQAGNGLREMETRYYAPYSISASLVVENTYVVLMLCFSLYLIYSFYFFLLSTGNSALQ